MSAPIGPGLAVNRLGVVHIGGYPFVVYTDDNPQTVGQSRGLADHLVPASAPHTADAGTTNHGGESC